MGGSALVGLIKEYDDAERIIDPEMYIKAGGELLALTILISTLITYIFNPDQLSDNPSITYLGYNNPCVPWDVPPALYFATVVFTFNAYLNIRFAVTASHRTRLTTPPHKHANLLVLVYVAFAVSYSVIMLIFVVTPEGGDERAYFHTIAFAQYVPMRFLVVAALFYEYAHLVTREQLTFLAVYGAVSCLDFVLLLFNLYNPDIPNERVPYWIFMCCDYAWFVCLPLTTVYLPANPHLHQPTKLMEA